MARDYRAENVRRNAQRRIKRITEQMSKTTSKKEFKKLQSQINTAKRDYEMTKKRTPTGKKRSEKSREKAISRLEKWNIEKGEQLFARKTRPSNVVTMHQMSLATNKKTESLSVYSKKEVSEFWSYTKPIWDTGETDAYKHRAEKVMKYYKTNNLAEAFEKAMKERAAALKALKEKYTSGDELTDEESEWLSEAEMTADSAEEKYVAIMVMIDTKIRNA